MAETFEELNQELTKIFENEPHVIQDQKDFERAIHATRLAVAKCETYFRKSQDIRALEEQVGLLTDIPNPINMMLVYVVCRRILDIDSNKKQATNTINQIIKPFFLHDDDQMSILMRSNDGQGIRESEEMMVENIAFILDGYFVKNKNDGFTIFLDKE